MRWYKIKDFNGNEFISNDLNRISKYLQENRAKISPELKDLKINVAGLDKLTDTQYVSYKSNLPRVTAQIRVIKELK